MVVYLCARLSVCLDKLHPCVSSQSSDSQPSDSQHTSCMTCLQVPFLICALLEPDSCQQLSLWDSVSSGDLQMSFRSILS
jgi:hypothetical protein